MTGLHKDAFVFDCHVDTLSRMLERRDHGLGADFIAGQPDLHLDLERMLKGGYTGAFFAMFVLDSSAFDNSIKHVLRLTRLADEIAELSDGRVTVARSVSEIEAAHAAGRLAIVLSIENACSLCGSIEVLHAFARLGVRSLGLVWNGRNELGDGWRVRGGYGLTDFGVRVVRECEKLGVLVDVSHLSDAGFSDVVENSDGPFVATHSNARSVCPHQRNLTDEQIKALAERGGVMGLNFCSAFLSGKEEGASIDDVVRHYLHIRDIGGPGAVALGTDFDGITSTPTGLSDAGFLPALTDALLAADVSESDVRAALGGNFMRVLKAVEVRG